MEVAREWLINGRETAIKRRLKMVPFDIKRIEGMEALYDALLHAVAEIEQGCAAEAEAEARKAALQPEIDRLAAYYSSEAWKADFAADEAGLLPANLKRGVLSEDGVYGILERFGEIEG